MKGKILVMSRLVASLIILLAITTIALIPIQANATTIKEIVSGILGTNKPTVQPVILPSSSPAAVSSLSQTPAATPQALASAADTGTAVKQVASAQAARSVAPVRYVSNRIDTELRDELFTIAIALMAIGGALYGMTYVAAPQKVAFASRRPLYIK